MIPTEFELTFRVVSETSLGEARSKKLADLIDYGDLATTVESMLRDASLKSP